MKTFYVPAMAAMVMVSAAFAAEGWETNMDAAKKKAVEEKKGLLIEFTGSDWCGPCMALKKNVLSKDEFLNAVKDRYVLVELDFPRKELSPEQTAHNDKYGELYGVDGYPTIVFADAEGRPVYSIVGGRDMETMKADIATSVKKSDLVAQTLTKLQTAKGDERFKLIGALFSEVPEEYIATFYKELADELKNDANDLSGFKKRQIAMEQGKELQELTRKVYSAGSKDDFDKSVKELEVFLKNSDLAPEVRQEGLFWSASASLRQGKIDEAFAELDEAIKAAPDSERAEDIRAYKDEMSEMRGVILVDNYANSLNVETRLTPGLFIAALEDYLKKHQDLSADGKQYIQRMIAYTLLIDDKLHEGLLKMQEAIDIAPDSKMGQSMKTNKKEFEADKEKVRSMMKEQRSKMDAERERLMKEEKEKAEKES